MKYLYAFLILGLSSNYAFSDEPNVIFEDTCEITPAIWQLSPPPDAYKTNNLRRKTGSTEFADGEMILVEGRVLDSSCAPIPEAVIEIWQGDAMGNYNKKKMDPKFLGSGTAITDNMGYYKFLTIFPGANHSKEAPHIHFRIKHKDFQPFETFMFFEDQAANDIDRYLNKEVQKSKKHLLLAKAKKMDNNEESSSIKYVFDITLEGKNKYLAY